MRLEPFQERLLEQIELARQQGHHRNLLVSATGTGKTVMAAVDYARLQARLPRARLLFVAHREEILSQIPLRRVGSVDDVAGVILFLASPMADYLNGVTIDINGGSWFQ